ncbi:MAG TPA: HAD family phosphatase [Candidatus Nanoarchaeia archaeon]|nr:HAD family phosphatase [Candidatus Nanoarchaeia archaeon]
MVYRLICFDMDGVIFRDVNFWMALHEKFGTLEEGKKLTKKYLHANYAKLVEEVVGKLWKGKDARPYFELVNSLEYFHGVTDVFAYVKKQDWITAIISSSSLDVARRVQHDFGVDHVFANELVIKEGKVSGDFVWPIGAGKHKKAEILLHLCSDLGLRSQETIFIGDSETDIEACREAGLSVAFNSKSEELKKAVNVVIDSENLLDILPVLKKATKIV